MLSLHTHHPVTQRLALIVGIGAFVILAFGVSFSSMWDLWQTSDHQHGLLVFPISMFLIWRLRYRLADVPLAPSAIGLLLIVPLALAWFIARLAGIQAVEHVVVILMIPAAVIGLAGPILFRKLLFPLMFLVLATPLGESLVPHLMVITADLSAGLLKISGFPIFRDGQYISLPGGEFVVADVCSGVRYLVAGIMISLLYGYLTYTSLRKRLVLVIVAAVILIFTNGVRAYIVMAVASATNMQYLGGRDHIYFGWLMFGVVMMMILWIGARYADEEEPGHEYRPRVVAKRASRTALPLIGALGLIMLAVTLKPLQKDFGETGVMMVAVAALFIFVFLLLRHKTRTDHSGSEGPGTIAFIFDRGRSLTAIVTIAILVMVPRFAETIESRAPASAIDLDLKTAVPCAYVGPWAKHWQPNYSKPDLEHSATFGCTGGEVSVFVASYASALQGSELISSSHYVVPPAWDRISDSSQYVIEDKDGQERTIVETTVVSPKYNALIWYWYEIDDRVASSASMAKFNQVIALVRGRPAGGRVVVIETTSSSGLTQARQLLSSAATGIIGAGTPVTREDET